MTRKPVRLFKDQREKKTNPQPDNASSFSKVILSFMYLSLEREWDSMVSWQGVAESGSRERMGGQIVRWEVPLTAYVQMTASILCCWNKGAASMDFVFPEFMTCILNLRRQQRNKEWLSTTKHSNAFQWQSPCAASGIPAGRLRWSVEEVAAGVCLLHAHVPLQELCFCGHCSWGPGKLLSAVCGYAH